MSIDERRKSPRVTKALEGGWGGASGKRPCRIGDLSTGGCFVESMSLPTVGDIAIVSISLPDGQLFEAAVEVVSIFASMGFGARFLDLSERDAQVLENAVARLLPM